MVEFFFFWKVCLDLFLLIFRGLHSFPHLLCLRPRWSWSFVQSGRKFCSRRGTDGNRRHQPAKLKMYFCKLQDVFVQMAKCICPNCKMYLYKWQNVFVQIARCIWTNGKMCLSKLQDVFEQMQIANQWESWINARVPKKGHTIVPRWSGDEGVGRVTKYWHWPGGGLRGSPPGILSLMIIFRGKHLLKKYNMMIIFRGWCKKEKNTVLLVQCS